MRPIATLLDRSRMLDPTGLPEELKLLYDGGLRFPAPRNQPYVIGNFVSTLDGVVSFEVPGKSGGGDISGFNEADRFTMGLLRASADAILVGEPTLREVASEHLWLAEHIYPEGRQKYARYRQRELNKPGPPLNVIVSGSGAVDLQKAVFRRPGLRTLIISRWRYNGSVANIPKLPREEFDVIKVPC